MSGYCKDCGNTICLCDEIEANVEDQKNKTKNKTKRELRKCLSGLLKVLNKKFTDKLETLDLSHNYEKGYCSAFEEILELVQIYKEELFKEKNK